MIKKKYGLLSSNSLMVLFIDSLSPVDIFINVFNLSTFEITFILLIYRSNYKVFHSNLILLRVITFMLSSIIATFCVFVPLGKSPGLKFHLIKFLHDKVVWMDYYNLTYFIP